MVDEPPRGENMLELVMSNRPDTTPDVKAGEGLGNSDYNMASFKIIFNQTVERGATKPIN